MLTMCWCGVFGSRVVRAPCILKPRSADALALIMEAADT